MTADPWSDSSGKVIPRASANAFSVAGSGVSSAGAIHNIAGTNTLSGSGHDGGTDFRVRQRLSTTVRLPGYGGAREEQGSRPGEQYRSEQYRSEQFRQRGYGQGDYDQEFGQGGGDYQGGGHYQGGGRYGSQGGRFGESGYGRGREYLSREGGREALAPEDIASAGCRPGRFRVPS